MKTLFVTCSLIPIKIWPAVRENAPKSSLIVMVVVLGLHFFLATGFMLYFFHNSVSIQTRLILNMVTLLGKSRYSL